MYFLSWFFYCVGSQWSISLSMLQEIGMKKEEWASWPIVFQHVLDVHFWRKVTWKTYVTECTTAGWEGKCLFVPLSLVFYDLFTRIIFICKLTFACLLDQNDSSCQLCCHKNSFDTSYICEITWETEDGVIFFTITWRTEDGKENNSSLSEIHTASLYIYLIYLQKFLREASCITVIYDLSA